MQISCRVDRRNAVPSSASRRPTRGNDAPSDGRLGVRDAEDNPFDAPDNTRRIGDPSGLRGERTRSPNRVADRPVSEDRRDALKAIQIFKPSPGFFLPSGDPGGMMYATPRIDRRSSEFR